jgi:hypothetical protein
MRFTSKNNAEILPVKILFITILCIIFVYVFVTVFSESLSDYILMNFRESKDPRIVFFVEALPLATDNFPLGSGFGTFGGYAAFIFDSPVYSKLHFDYYFWYREGKWMTDTFYPHIIAESGYIGFICYILAIIYLFKYIGKNLTIEGKKVCFCACVYLLLCSVSAPIMNDALAIILYATIPVIFNNNNRLHYAKRNPVCIN